MRHVPLMFWLVLVLSGCGGFLTVDGPIEGSDGGTAGDAAAATVRSRENADSDAGLQTDAAAPDATADAPPDASAPPYVFMPTLGAASFADDFGRADGVVGNGWIENVAGRFALASGTVRQTSTAWPDLLWRPETELGVEIEAVYTLSDGASWARLYARLRHETADPSCVDAYGLRVNSASVAIVRDLCSGAQSASQVLATAPLAPLVAVGQPLRLRLRVTGPDIVLVEGALYRGGSASPAASLRATDESADRLYTAGSVGFATSASGSQWDAVKRWDL